MKIVKRFRLKIVNFTALKNRCMLHGHVFVMIDSLSQIQSACHNKVNGVKPGSNFKMTDKLAAKFSKTASWDIIK